jgi:hypothetical protein
VKSPTARSSAEVLRYRPKQANRATVRRHYAKWRREHGMPMRCDNPACAFHTEPLSWNGKPLPLILDHANGNNRDNSPKNLRYLCPNCESQLLTRGGANRGRVEDAGDGKYTLVSRDGRRNHVFIPESGSFRITGLAPTLVIKPSGDGE